MTYGSIGEECYATTCHETATHEVTTKDISNGPVSEVTAAYCLKDALYFAAWLPYCYPDEYELVSIMPPASELFKENRNG